MLLPINYFANNHKMRQLLLIAFLVNILVQVSSFDTRKIQIKQMNNPFYLHSQNREFCKLFMRAASSVTNSVKSNGNALLIGQNIPKVISDLIMNSSPMTNLLAIMPNILKSFLKCIYPGELILFILFQFNYSKVLKFAHKTQGLVWKMLSKGTPVEWNNSILGFVETRCSSLSKLIGCNYIAKLICVVLARLGLNIRADFPDLLSSISYTLFISQSADRFKTQFLRTFFPKIGESRRSSYMVNKSSSVVIWTIGGLVVCEMLSSYLKIPLSSTLAFGGVGGLAIGLSLRDIAANFLGGMLLLINEPFTPGDMVTFTSGKTELVGRVERVGWGQTRIRGRDTRPTYVPNAHFVQTSVTNMERITHRKFESIVPIRFADYAVMNDVIIRMKERLRTISKLDVLSMPFRVSFIRVGTYCLEIEITCYFATKSIDEFLTLQQMANMELIAAIQDCGAQLALPTSFMQLDQNIFTSSGIKTLTIDSIGDDLKNTSNEIDILLNEKEQDTINPSSPTNVVLSTFATDDNSTQNDLQTSSFAIKPSTTNFSTEVKVNMEYTESIPILTTAESSSAFSFGVKTFGESNDISSSVVDGTVQRITAAAVSTASVFPDLGLATDNHIDLKGFEYKWVKSSSDDEVVVVINQKNSTSSNSSRTESSEDIWHASIRSAGILTDGRKYFDGLKSAVDLINDSSPTNNTTVSEELVYRPQPILVNSSTSTNNTITSTALSSLVIPSPSLLSPLPSITTTTTAPIDEPSAFWENDKILHPPQSTTDFSSSSVSVQQQQQQQENINLISTTTASITVETLPPIIPTTTITMNATTENENESNS